MTFQPEEITLFQTRFEEGYDVGDDRYQHWVRMYHPERSQADSTLGKCRSQCSLSDPSVHREEPTSSTPISSNVWPHSSFLSRLLANRAPIVKYPVKYQIQEVEAECLLAQRISAI